VIEATPDQRDSLLWNFTVLLVAVRSVIDAMADED
jgi:hypothetical protein